MLPTKELSIFIILLFGGETALTFVVYIASLGYIDILSVALIFLLATILADSIWYFIGRHFFSHRLSKKYLFPKVESVLQKSEPLFSRHGLKLLFLSKFVYGTRVAAQLLSGLHRLSYLKYLLVTILAGLSWTTLLFALLFFVNFSLETLQVAVWKTQLGLLIFLALTITVHLLIKNYYRQL